MIFTELPGFTKEVLRLLADDDYAELQLALVAKPELGKVIKASGGLRKMRWALPGRGKSGGVRVIYYFWVRPEVITLCDIYPKNEKKNLTDHEIQTIRKEIDSLRRPPQG